MTAAAKTFRVFVSSTFNDLKVERNALEERVFPKLRDLCGQHGCRFQPVDLRWGVSEQVALEQRTMRICLGEIGRCQKMTPRPNFIALLGDRYGWRPLPDVIPATEYEAIARYMGEATGRVLWQQWYRRDDNAVPPEYVLLPRVGRLQEYSVWARDVETPLRDAIANALRQLDWSAERKRRYEASATEQEIVAGALGVTDAQEHVFCFARVIHGLPRDRRAGAFIDLDEDGNLDVEAQARLGTLKKELFDLLGPDQAFRYDTRWSDLGPELSHLDRLCEDVYTGLLRVISPQLEEVRRLNAGRLAADQHELFCRQRAATHNFEQALFANRECDEKIAAYLAGTNRHWLVLLAEPGSGASSVIGSAVETARVAHPDAHVVARFVGVTPESTDGHALLADLCEKLRGRYGAAGPRASARVSELAATVRETLGLATRRAPLIVFLDGLGLLSECTRMRTLASLPSELPEHVHLVLSISTQAADCHDVIAARVPAENRLMVRTLESVWRERAGDLLDEWLAPAGRTLQEDQREHALARLAVSGSPLYVMNFIKFAIEEMKCWHSYDGVPMYRGRSGVAGDVKGILRDLLWRLSAGGSHSQALVSRSVAYLGASKRGLAEDELLDLLSQDEEVYAEFLASTEHFPPDLIAHATKHLAQSATMDDAETAATVSDAAGEAFLRGLLTNPVALRVFLTPVLAEPDAPRLPIVLWARLRADLEPYLQVRDADGVELLHLFHRSLSDVVSEDYLAATDRKAFHRCLASYFAERPLWVPGTAIANQRKISELPYQQVKGELWSELVATLTDFDFLEAKALAAGREELLEDLELAVRESATDPVDRRARERDALVLLRDAVREFAALPLAEGARFAELLVTRLGTSQNPLVLRLLQQASRRL